MLQAERPRVGYVMKMYPRFSETFIVNEILAHEAAGLDLELFSLRPPADGRFHESLAAVQAPVTYLTPSVHKGQTVWDVLAGARPLLPRLADHLDELLAADVRDAVQAVELAAAVVTRQITHLHAHFGSVATTVARLAGALAGVPYSFTAHAKDIYHEEVDGDDLRRKLADAAAVATVSDYNLAHLRAVHGDAAAGVVRVYNGLDLTRFRYQSPAERPPVIVAVGRLVEKKGFADLVDAVALLAADGVDVRCDIIGDGAEREALARRIAERDVGDHVRLLGPLPQHQVVAHVAGAAAFAAPCVVGSDGNRDGLPTVLLEAMALGTPIVSTDVTGIPEVLDDERTGLAVAQHDPRGLAAALARLVDDAPLRCRLAEAARARIEEDFDVARQAAALRRDVFGLDDATAEVAAVTAGAVA